MDLFIIQYYSVYDLVKDVPERDIEDDLTDDTDSDTDVDHVFGDPKVLWENMPPEHKMIVKEMFDTVNKQVEQAKYAEKYNIPLGRNYSHLRVVMIESFRCNKWWRSRRRFQCFRWRKIKSL